MFLLKKKTSMSTCSGVRLALKFDTKGPSTEDTVFSQKDAVAIICLFAGIGAAVNRGQLLFEGSVYFFQHVMLAWPLPQLNAVLMVVPHLCIGTRTFIKRYGSTS